MLCWEGGAGPLKMSLSSFIEPIARDMPAKMKSHTQTVTVKTGPLAALLVDDVEGLVGREVEAAMEQRKRGDEPNAERRIYFPAPLFSPPTISRGRPSCIRFRQPLSISRALVPSGSRSFSLEEAPRNGDWNEGAVACLPQLAIRGGLGLLRSLIFRSFYASTSRLCRSSSSIC